MQCFCSDFNFPKYQDLLEKTKPRLPPAPPHSRSLGEIREGRREGREGGFNRREEREGGVGGGRRMSEEEMSMLLREVRVIFIINIIIVIGNFLNYVPNQNEKF